MDKASLLRLTLIIALKIKFRLIVNDLGKREPSSVVRIRVNLSVALGHFEKILQSVQFGVDVLRLLGVFFATLEGRLHFFGSVERALSETGANEAV